jgi:hypothetical protein
MSKKQRQARNRNFMIFRLEGVRTTLRLASRFSVHFRTAMEHVEAGLREIRNGKKSDR